MARNSSPLWCCSSTVSADVMQPLHARQSCRVTFTESPTCRRTCRALRVRCALPMGVQTCPASCARTSGAFSAAEPGPRGTGSARLLCSCTSGGAGASCGEHAEQQGGSASAALACSHEGMRYWPGGRQAGSVGGKHGGRSGGGAQRARGPCCHAAAATLLGAGAHHGTHGLDLAPVQRHHAGLRGRDVVVEVRDAHSAREGRHGADLGPCRVMGEARLRAAHFGLSQARSVCGAATPAPTARGPPQLPAVSQALPAAPPGANGAARGHTAAAARPRWPVRAAANLPRASSTAEHAHATAAWLQPVWFQPDQAAAAAGRAAHALLDAAPVRSLRASCTLLSLRGLSSCSQEHTAKPSA